MSLQGGRREKQETMTQPVEETPRPKQEEKPPGIRRLSMIVFAILMFSIVISATVMSIHFNNPEWFKYGVGGVFTSLVVIAFFGWPVQD